MLVIPQLLDPALGREQVVAALAPELKSRKQGIVGLCPSFKMSELWANNGATVADTASISRRVEALKAGECSKSLCIVNRYDGVDLPDDACRILVIDSKPHGAALVDRYLESCRPNSDFMAQRTARIVEQGLGRSVRGEKDFCAIVLTGGDLVQATRSAEVQRFYSAQTKKQFEIGFEIAAFAKDDIVEGAAPLAAFKGLLRKLLDRDEGWKEFYVDRMKTIAPKKQDEKLLELFEVELKAQSKAEASRFDEAAAVLQSLLDSRTFPDDERGWYLQEIARYTYRFSKSDSAKLQVAAHTYNTYLLRPRGGVTVRKLEKIPQRRTEAIATWVAKSANYDDLMIRVDGILTHLRFGCDAANFEESMHRLGEALGYASERPDKEWGEGPDNLWCLGANEYLLIECKNGVVDRETIAKSECGQINTSCAWLRDKYGGVTIHPILVFPGKELGKGASFVDTVTVMRKRELHTLVRHVREFFSEFAKVELGDIDPNAVHRWLETHELSTKNVVEKYSIVVRK